MIKASIKGLVATAVFTTIFLPSATSAQMMNAAPPTASQPMQSPPPPPPVTPHTHSAANIPIGVLASVLGLSQGQVVKINALQTEGRSHWIMRSTLIEDPNALQAQVDKADAATASQITALLNNRQKQELTRLINEVSIVSDDLIPTALAVKLGFSSDQLQRIKAINDASEANFRQQMKPYQNSGKPYQELPKSVGEVLHSLTQKRIEDMLTILTPQQHSILDSFIQQSPGFQKVWNDFLNNQPAPGLPVHAPAK